jgi:hypothetical protein
MLDAVHLPTGNEIEEKIPAPHPVIVDHFGKILTVIASLVLLHVTPPRTRLVISHYIVLVYGKRGRRTEELPISIVGW